MIKGTGADIIEIDRIERAFNCSNKFFSRIFTKKEREYLQSTGLKFATMAGYFAAKEATSKALGTGFRDFSFKDIEITKDAVNKPSISLHGEAKSIAESLGVNHIHLSISHNRTTAIAYVVME